MLQFKHFCIKALHSSWCLSISSPSRNQQHVQVSSVLLSSLRLLLWLYQPHCHLIPPFSFPSFPSNNNHHRHHLNCYHHGDNNCYNNGNNNGYNYCDDNKKEQQKEEKCWWSGVGFCLREARVSDQDLSKAKTCLNIWVPGNLQPKFCFTHYVIISGEHAYTSFDNEEDLFSSDVILQMPVS